MTRITAGMVITFFGFGFRGHTIRMQRTSTVVGSTEANRLLLMSSSSGEWGGDINEFPQTSMQKARNTHSLQCSRTNVRELQEPNAHDTTEKT